MLDARRRKGESEWSLFNRYMYEYNVPLLIRLVFDSVFHVRSDRGHNYVQYEANDTE